MDNVSRKTSRATVYYTNDDSMSFDYISCKGCKNELHFELPDGNIKVVSLNTDIKHVILK